VNAVQEFLVEGIEKQHGIKTKVIVEGEKMRINDDIRAILYRNIRELLTNVVKHAQASHVKVVFEFAEKSMKVQVIDDGKGYDTSSALGNRYNKDSFGLFSIEERMTDLGGSFEIASEPGDGCSAVLIVPLG
jgi:signal transduction histidine kinase